MMPFMAVAAVMVVAALGLVLIPLLRSSRRQVRRGEDIAVLVDGVRELDAALAVGDINQEEHQRAQTELQRQALDAKQADLVQATSSQRANWMIALATAVALPLLTIGLYVSIGQPAALGRMDTQAPANQTLAQAPREADIVALQERVIKDGKDVEAWVLLARANVQLGHTDEALSAYSKATELVTDSPDLWVEYANAVALAHGRDLTGEPTVMVERALQLDPNNLNALAFAGLAAMQQGNPAKALKHWEHLKTILPEGAKDTQTIDELIARARAQAQGGDKTSTAQPAATPPAGISGTVIMTPSLADKVVSTDTLFVFARAPQGPPMPLAAVRIPATGWPIAFHLDDSSAMAQDMQLSKFAKVDLVARVSKSGSATPQPGDVEGRITDVASDSKGVHIVLDRVIEK